MDITEKHLRALTKEVDEQHRAGMAGLPTQIAELHHGEGRRVLAPPRPGTMIGTALVAGALTIPLAAAFRAYAADGGDGGVAAFAESVELAAVEAYKAAAASGLVTVKAVLDAATMFAGHHQEHAAAFGAAAGRPRPRSRTRSCSRRSPDSSRRPPTRPACSRSPSISRTRRRPPTCSPSARSPRRRPCS